MASSGAASLPSRKPYSLRSTLSPWLPLNTQGPRYPFLQAKEPQDITSSNVSGEKLLTRNGGRQWAQGIHVQAAPSLSAVDLLTGEGSAKQPAGKARC